MHRWQAKLDKSGELFGKVIPFAMTLLFIPVARGSPILRLIHVPFDQAVRYHRWLGHLTMLLITTHGVLYSIYYSSRHESLMVCLQIALISYIFYQLQASEGVKNKNILTFYVVL